MTAGTPRGHYCRRGHGRRVCGNRIATGEGLLAGASWAAVCTVCAVFAGRGGLAVVAALLVALVAGCAAVTWLRRHRARCAVTAGLRAPVRLSDQVTP